MLLSVEFWITFKTYLKGAPFYNALEERRLLGARLLRQGVHPAEVARQVGVHRQSVSRWAEQLKQGGLRALKKAGHAGRRARLRPEDLRRIERGLKRGPKALGYETSLWTSWRVAHLIEQECGVKYHPSQAWRILRQLGWSCDAVSVTNTISPTTLNTAPRPWLTLWSSSSRAV